MNLYKPSYKKIFAKDDFDKYWMDTGFKNLYTTNATLTDNQWLYNTLGNFVHIKKLNNKNALLKIPLGNVNIGDIIEFTFEYITISGIVPSIFYGYKDVGSTDVQMDNSHILTVSGKWQTVTEKIVITQNDKSFGIILGVATLDPAEYMIKNIQIKSLKANYSDDVATGGGSAYTPPLSTRLLSVKKVDGGWEYDSTIYSSETGSFSTSGKSLICIFNNPLTGAKKPIPSVTMGFTSGLYFAKVVATYNNQIHLNFYDFNNLSVALDSTAMPTGLQMFIALSQYN